MIDPFRQEAWKEYDTTGDVEDNAKQGVAYQPARKEPDDGNIDCANTNAKRDRGQITTNCGDRVCRYWIGTNDWQNRHDYEPFRTWVGGGSGIEARHDLSITVREGRASRPITRFGASEAYPLRLYARPKSCVSSAPSARLLRQGNRTRRMRHKLQYPTL